MAARGRRGISTPPSEAAATRLAAARPTAVNLAAAVARMRRVVDGTAAGTPAERVARARAGGGAIAAEDRAACEAMARLGADWLARAGPAGRRSRS